MNWLDLNGFLLICVIFVPLERLLALRPGQRILRRAWPLDLIHFVTTGILVKLGLGFAILALMLVAEELVPRDLRAAVAAQPVWLQVVEVLLLADLGFYFAHRAFHAIPALWRIHAVHHSIEEMDWLASYRVHPIDQILTKTASFVPIFFLGFSVEAIVIFAVIYKWQSLLIHSNVRIAFGIFDWIIASPKFHHWHHANCPEAIDKNFAGQLAIWDLVLGTSHLPRGRVPERYGTDEPIPRSYVAQLIHPFARTAARGGDRSEAGAATQVVSPQ